ncbi:glycosyltransferase [Rhodococcus sp. P1Y]|uniref:glycosyltransferase n=1 Tax=Rhodococcus sp. P1Y TaxID=1302308 RepID=UPI000EB17DFA|nr:glycosyltransferase family A protein [Rhodococcus sp. P1Y]AYJ50006.1 glycosyltransferase [Rhodococcus sp. P1Y]
MGNAQSPDPAPRNCCVIENSVSFRRIVAAGSVLSGLAAAATIVNAATMRALVRPQDDIDDPVVVCIPARDEVATLPDLLRDLRAQTHCRSLRVLVLDDGSVDGTADAAMSVVGSDRRFTIERSTAAPPAGWTGKAAACHVLAELACAQPVRFIAFVDADVRLDTGAIAAAVSEVRSSGASLVSPWPRQEANTLAEALVQPLLRFSWMSTLPVRVANASYMPSTVVACGQFLMFDADAYRSIGGHRSVFGSPTEDLDIARVLRRRGHRTAVVSGGGLVRCRMYDGWADVREGYTRWLWSAFGGPAGSVAVLSAVSVAYLAPPVAAVVGSGRTRMWGAAGYAAAVLARAVSARADSGPETSVSRTLAVSSAHPVSALIYAALTVDSLRRRRNGTTRWKGRSLVAA